MIRHQLLLFSLCLCAPLLACSPGSEGPSENTGDGDANETGAMDTDQGDGENPTLMSSPIATGPGLDGAVADSCDDFECDSERRGSWLLTSRCDLNGSWQDPACPTAVYSWSLRSSSGRVDFDQSTGDWNVQTSLDWVIAVPASCGGCDVMANDPRQSVDGLDCQAASDGSCSCTGTTEESQIWTGTVFGAADNGWFLEEDLTREDISSGKTERVRHDFWTCSGQTQMIIYDENGARLQFSRIAD